MHKYFIIWRYLKKRRMAVLGSLAVGLCVALLIVITSLFDGFIHSLRHYWQDAFGELTLSPGRPIHDYDTLARYLREVDGVADVRVTNIMGALLYLGRGDLRGVEVQGIMPGRLREDSVFQQGLVLSEEQTGGSGLALSPQAKERAAAWLEKRRQPADEEHLPVGIILGVGLLGRLNEKTDSYDLDEVRQLLRNRTSPVTIISGKYGQTSGEVKARKIQQMCWPVNAVQTGISFSDRYYVYVPFDYLRDLIGTPDELGRMQCMANVSIFLKEDARLDQVENRLRRAWTEYAGENLGWSGEQIAASDLSDPMNLHWIRLITGEIRKQLAIMQMLMGLICLVAALLVFVILFMMVMQKKKDIGILRALGATRVGVAGMFLGYGAGIGLGGALLGLGLGFWATKNIALLEAVLSKILGFKIWSSSVYVFSEIPDKVAWPSVWWILVVGVITAMLGAVLPAVNAARLQPVDSLRHE